MLYRSVYGYGLGLASELLYQGGLSWIEVIE